jgi:hypothetical protein
MGNQNSLEGTDSEGGHPLQRRSQAEQENVLSQLQSKLSNMGLSPQEIQAKVADKLKLSKSKSTPAS